MKAPREKGSSGWKAPRRKRETDTPSSSDGRSGRYEREGTKEEEDKGPKTVPFFWACGVAWSCMRGQSHCQEINTVRQSYCFASSCFVHTCTIHAACNMLLTVHVAKIKMCLVNQNKECVYVCLELEKIHVSICSSPLSLASTNALFFPPPPGNDVSVNTREGQLRNWEGLPRPQFNWGLLLIILAKFHPRVS